MRFRTPVGLSSRVQQRGQAADVGKVFGLPPLVQRQRRACRSTKTQTVTRAPLEEQQQQQQQRKQNGENSHEWEAQEQLASLLSALPLPSPQDMLDGTASQQASKTLEEAPQKAAETIQKAPGIGFCPISSSDCIVHTQEIRCTWDCRVT